MTLASHELRAPAAAIHEIAKTLAGRAGPLQADQVSALHELLLKNTELLTRLLDELLDLSRADAGGIDIAPAPLAIRARIEELVHSLAGDRAARSPSTCRASSPRSSMPRPSIASSGISSRTRCSTGDPR